MAVVIAIDAGTTGVRAIAFDHGGRPTASSYREFPQHFPRPGWVEHDATQIWDAVVDVLGEVGAAVRDAGQAVAALGITNQRETVVAWDRRTGHARCTGPSCGRTAARRRAATSSAPPATSRSSATTTGLVLDPYFSGTKLEWLFTEGGVRPGPDLAVGTIDSWLVWKLTGGAVHATDATNASRTMLFDIRRGHVVGRAVRPARGPGGGAADGRAVERTPRGDRRRLPARRRGADQRARRRPAGLAVRSGVLRAGHGQEHLRHRQLRAGERRHRPARSRSTACSPPSPGRCRARIGTPSSPTPSRGRSSPPAPRCSGSATASG